MGQSNCSTPGIAGVPKTTKNVFLWSSYHHQLFFIRRRLYHSCFRGTSDSFTWAPIGPEMYCSNSQVQKLQSRCYQSFPITTTVERGFKDSRDSLHWWESGSNPSLDSLSTASLIYLKFQSYYTRNKHPQSGFFLGTWCVKTWWAVAQDTGSPITWNKSPQSSDAYAHSCPWIPKEVYIKHDWNQISTTCYQQLPRHQPRTSRQHQSRNCKAVVESDSQFQWEVNLDRLWSKNLSENLPSPFVFFSFPFSNHWLHSQFLSLWMRLLSSFLFFWYHIGFNFKHVKSVVVWNWVISILGCNLFEWIGFGVVCVCELNFPIIKGGFQLAS